ncbi:MAG: aspartyl/asparaginyl beta-hydroxylase domain-containing protein [Saprospiraceae bacterium]
MIILKIIGIIILTLAALLLLAYIFQPALLTLPYSAVIKFFVKNPPFLDVEEHFPAHRELLANWKTIRAELEEVLIHDEDIPKFHEVDSIQRFISARDEVPWRTYIVKAYSKWSVNNAAQVPKTAALLRQMPQITTALFSILDGGKCIPPHMGFFKGVLRYHLALIVPTDAPCYIVVGGKKYTWKEGEDVLFDDTYTHEVWNKSSHRRVVLFCDLYRENGLPAWVQFFNRKIFNILARSSRLTNVLKRAEVTRNLLQPQDA